MTQAVYTMAYLVSRNGGGGNGAKLTPHSPPLTPRPKKNFPLRLDLLAGVSSECKYTSCLDENIRSLNNNTIIRYRTESQCRDVRTGRFVGDLSEQMCLTFTRKLPAAYNLSTAMEFNTRFVLVSTDTCTSFKTGGSSRMSNIYKSTDIYIILTFSIKPFICVSVEMPVLLK